MGPSSITLKPGESKKVEVTVKRQPGFEGTVTLDAIYQHLDFVYNNSLPPGVTIDTGASQTLLTGKQSKGWITLKAAADAKPVEKQQVPIMVHASINFAIKFTYCGEPLLVDGGEVGLSFSLRPVTRVAVPLDTRWPGQGFGGVNESRKSIMACWLTFSSPC